MEPTSSILSARTENDRLILTLLISTIDSDCAIQLRDELQGAIDAVAPGVTRVLLDVSQLLAMSSRGFESFLQLHTSCRARGLELTLSKLTPTFHRLLDRMGFLRLFVIEE